MAGDGANKGVMLCERPAHASHGHAIEPVFRPPASTQQLEPLGLTPIKKVHTSAVMEKPPGINTIHRKWVKEFDSEMKERKAAEEQAYAEAEQKRQQVAAFSTKLRTTILNNEPVDFWKPVSQANTIKQKLTAKATSSGDSPSNTQAADGRPPAPNELLDGIDDFVNAVYNEAAAVLSPAAKQASSPLQQAEAPAATSSSPAPVTRPASAGSQREGGGAPSTSGREERPGSSTPAPKPKPKSKPAWALSENEVEGMLAAEEEDLLAFADGLDFDLFIGQLDDVELQDTFKALQEAETAQSKGPGTDKAWKKSFVRAMN
eukprot:CAMPEP_0202897464 /NCGR_PEP_ID=MMETSP1392-20130828/6211_1 /ASSEMBLY_ACC=CAM_ASM_000868 /TAXON_ID=225041 /ORGANISM="Chlamydomonas chlamydogama, Strain SAG 11-48b" /LENGTH=317 /DNA_ID=CAMNT_0049583093 /DNA_START=42 /DNA_END=992 /DNA_ORIENTATION=+